MRHATAHVLHKGGMAEHLPCKVSAAALKLFRIQLMAELRIPRPALSRLNKSGLSGSSGAPTLSFVQEKGSHAIPPGLEALAFST